MKKQMICLKILFAIIMFPGFGVIYAQTVSSNIALNQLGFYPRAPKVAVITGNTGEDNFYLISTPRNDTAYRGKLGPIKQSANSAIQASVADFTPFQKTGSFLLVVPGGGSSYIFNIVPNVNHPVAVSSLKGFYFQRVSMPLEEQYAGKWHRAAGHPDTAVLIHPSAASAKRPEGSVVSTPGGWYDAGDYNKYVVNSGISMGTLLSAYEDFSAYFDTLKTNIPESNDGVPDILNEALYNLRWMLSMQDPQDGGVYNKCTNATFDGMVMPGVTTAPRYVVAKGTAATLDFAAVTSQAARILKKFGKQFPGLSDSCLAASVKAWKWAQKFPGLSYDQNAINKTFEPKITTGGYGDQNFKDEWYWAAVELLMTTNDNQYIAVINENIARPVSMPSWANVQMLGNYTLLRQEKKLPEILRPAVGLMKEKLIQFADELAGSVQANAFQTVMGRSRNDFNWGSNSNAANQGILLVNAYRITKKKNYLDAALTNLDYILGRNATGYCFVTGLGTKSTLHPHHRQSVSDGILEPVPGLMAGGPNPGMQDHSHYDFTEPETAYADLDGAYASNEIAINWNAPLVYLANAIEMLSANL